MISIICPYTKPDILNNMLVNSLDAQSYKEYEKIFIATNEMKFSSASEVLNYGVQQAKGDILLFVHQDVELLDKEILYKISIYTERYSYGIGCVAGVLDNGTIFSSVTQGENHEQVGIKISEPMIVSSCDECMFFIQKNSFKGFLNLGKTWHFYAVEYALRCKKEGENVCVFPLSIYHLSPGWSRDDSYWVTLGKLARKYSEDFSIIPTTIGVFKNNSTLSLYIVYKRIKNIIKKIIGYR